MRIEPVNPPYAEAVQALFDRLPASWSPPFRLFTVLARDERLLLRFTGGAVSYLEPSHVTLRQREVLLLRVTGRCRCAYEWGLRAHYFAGEAGLGDAQLRASVHGETDDPAWSPDDRLLVRLADELHDTVSISDALWADLRAAFTEEAILQLIMMAGYYRTVAYIANGTRLPLEPKVARSFPEPEPRA
ncbi:MAG TPA: carboxymuconolactone decarboxylase family protein [Alphaproteobacteria bacterium]|jgi:alkylhydroperoxidase family enzyme|nr:carboxymuconolactone decarboxylase family protein [Alphaproteobacteria bacterium]